jgi:hypothetical protein
LTNALIILINVYLNEKELITDNPINGGGTLQIYNAVLNDMNSDFVEAGKLNIHYLGAMWKDTLTTKKDATNFIKKNAAGTNDKGLYAATQAQAEIAANKANMYSNIVPNSLASKALDSVASSLTNLLIEQTAFLAEAQADMNGVMGDSNCDNDATYNQTKIDLGLCQIPGTQYPRPGQLFPDTDQVAMNAPSVTAGAASVGVSLMAVFVVMAAVFAN